MTSSRAPDESSGVVRCRKLAVAGALALWVALLAASFGRYAWPLDLFSHFRLQYAALFGIAALILAALRRRTLAALSVCGALASAVPIVSYMGSGTPHAQAGPASFRVVSFNVWFRNHDYERIARYLEQTAADAIVLQELTQRQAAELHARLAAYPHAQLGPGRTGAVIFARWPITRAELLPLTPRGVRATQVVLDWRGVPVTVLGVHLHWPLGRMNSRLRNQELASLAAVAASRTGPLVIAGDLNITPWSAHFQDMIKRSGLQDCAAGHGFAPSWPAQFPPLGIRIDHCLASTHWRSVQVSTGPYLGSDHLPVIAELQLRR